jgi:hypothetical protein
MPAVTFVEALPHPTEQDVVTVAGMPQVGSPTSGVAAQTSPHVNCGGFPPVTSLPSLLSGAPPAHRRRGGPPGPVL